MDAESAPPADARAEDVLFELDATAALLGELADGARSPDRAARIAAARGVLARARHVIESQDEALRAFAGSVGELGRQLEASHARFAEWMARSPDVTHPADSPGS